MTITEAVEVKSRDELITDWYVNVFPHVATYVQRNGGDLNAAKEIFHEALVQYYEKWSASDFSPENSHEAYLMGIVKNKWLKFCRRQRHHVALSEVDKAAVNEKRPVSQKLLDYLKLTGEKCMDLLQAFYYEKLNMAQLADRFDYKGERSATVQKYKCLEKVRDQVKSKSLSYEDFLD